MKKFLLAMVAVFCFSHAAKAVQYIDWKAVQPDSTELRLSDLVGKTDYVLLDFWASWCGPCRASMPALKALYAEAPKGSLEIVGINMDSNRDAWLNAIQALGLPWRHMSDLKKWNCECARIYGVNAIPCTYLIDKNGTIVGRNMPHDAIKALLTAPKK